MLLLTSTSDLIQLITGSAGTIKVHASYSDVTTGPTVTVGRTNTPSITTATTTTIVASPASSTQRNVRYISIRNTDATVTNACTVQHTDGTNVEPLWIGSLAPGEAVMFDQNGIWSVYSSGGVIKSAGSTSILFNNSVASQGAGFATDTYLVGSNIQIPNTGPKVGTKYVCRFDAVKTAAGTATPIVNLRIGTNGSTADTARCTFTWTAGTAAADTGTFEISGIFRTVGASTSAVIQGRGELRHGTSATTGLVNLVAPTLQSTSSGFDSTVANSIIGLSVNGGASASWTVQLVDAELLNF